MLRLIRNIFLPIKKQVKTLIKSLVARALKELQTHTLYDVLVFVLEKLPTCFKNKRIVEYILKVAKEVNA